MAVDVVAERVADDGVALQLVDRLAQRAGQLADARRRRSVPRPSRRGSPRPDAPSSMLLLDAVQAGGDHDREGEVGVRGRIGAADLGAGRLDGLARRDLRHADQRRAVGPAPGQVGRRLVAGDQPLVRVDQRREDRAHAAGVGEDAGHERARHVREAVRGRGSAKALRLPVDRVEALVRVHAGAVDPEDRLRHERGVQPVLLGDRLQRELEGDGVVGGAQRVGVLEVDLVLAGGDLVVGRLDLDPERLERVHHVLADFLRQVGGEVEVAGLVVRQRRDGAVLVAPEEEELQLRAGVDDVAQLAARAPPAGAGRRADRRRTARRSG